MDSDLFIHWTVYWLLLHNSGRLYSETKKKHTRSCSTSLRQSVGFGTKLFWRNCTTSGFPRFWHLYRGNQGTYFVQVHYVLPQPVPEIDNISKGSVLAHTSVLLLIGDPLSKVYNPIHTFVDEATVYCFTSYRIYCHANNHRSWTSSLVYLYASILNRPVDSATSLHLELPKPTLFQFLLEDIHSSHIRLSFDWNWQSTTDLSFSWFVH